MTFTPATEIDALKKAIASGVTRVTYNGRTVEYADLKSLRQRLKWLESQETSTTLHKRALGKFMTGA